MEILVSSVCCLAMRVTYVPRISDVARAPPGGDFEILIPGELSDGIVIELERGYFLRMAGSPRSVERIIGLDPLMRGVGNALSADFLSQRPPSVPFLESLAVVIALHLARNYFDGRRALRAWVGLAPHKLARVRAYVDEHLADSVRVKHLAAVVHMSPFHFARTFKQATGQSPHAFLTARRVSRAKELLLDSRLTLVDVAASVGFQTQGHFTEVFHRHAGLTPRHFRRAENGRNDRYASKPREELSRASA
jgi:AraC-like DNA-binding protein